MPPKAQKSGANSSANDGLARLQLAYNHMSLFLVRECHRTNFDPTAVANLRSFMQEKDPMSDAFLMQQDTLQDDKKQELLGMTLAFLFSITQKHYGEESSPFLMKMVMLCGQFQEKGMVSQKTLNQLLTESGLPENIADSQEGFIPKMLDKMKHFMSEWLRLARVKLHLEKKREEHHDIGLFCTMVLAAEQCRKDIVLILADTARTPNERLASIHLVCEGFHTSFPHPRALALFQHSVGCYIPSKADVTATLNAIDRLGITKMIDIFCGRALFVAILRMYTHVPIIGCDVELHDPFVTEGIRQYDAHAFMMKYLTRADPNERLLFAMVWPPSENHLVDSKVDASDLAPQDRILSCRDPRIAGILVVSDKTDCNIMLFDRGTVIGSERSEDLLNNPELFRQIHTSQVPPMNTGDFQPCAPVCTWLSIYKTLH